MVCACIFFVLTLLPASAMAWNIPTHMVHGAMTYRILRQENPATIEAVRLILEHHPGRRDAGKAGWKNYPNETEMKCSSCSLHGGPMTYALKIKSGTVGSGIILTVPLSLPVNRKAFKPDRHRSQTS